MQGSDLESCERGEGESYGLENLWHWTDITEDVG